ncbi:MAG: hypothetical protein RDU01_03945 [Thermodesulfovibrionales bacterium]|nr:hypothetical protein [Thermodesulfovibrionales bacterium]
MESIYDNIIMAADELKASLEADPMHPNITALRKLRHFCSRIFLESQHNKDRFICFFICSFIDDIFLNLGGDTPYDLQLHKERISLYNKISEILTKIGRECGEENNAQRLLDNLSALVSNYADSINFLNKTMVSS